MWVFSRGEEGWGKRGESGGGQVGADCVCVCVIARCGGDPAVGGGETVAEGGVQGVVCGFAVQYGGGFVYAVSAATEGAKHKQEGWGGGCGE